MKFIGVFAAFSFALTGTFCFVAHQKQKESAERWNAQQARWAAIEQKHIADIKEVEEKERKRIDDYLRQEQLRSAVEKDLRRIREHEQTLNSR